MPLAAHAEDNCRSSQDSHDDAGCKEITVPVGAALKGGPGFHDESRISRPSAVSIRPTRDQFLLMQWAALVWRQNCRRPGERNGTTQDAWPDFKCNVQKAQSSRSRCWIPSEQLFFFP